MCLPSLGTSEPTVGTPDWSRPMGFYPSLQGLPYPYVCYVCLCVSHFSPKRGSRRPGFASCRLPVAFLSQKNTLPLSCRSPVALLSLSCRFLLSLPCRFPVAASLVALLSSSCRFPVAYPVAMSCFLSLPCRHPVAALSPPCRPPVALLSHLPCRLPVACLSLPVASLPLSCRWPVVFLSPPCRLPVATLSPSCRSLPHFTVACLAWPESTQGDIAAHSVENTLEVSQDQAAYRTHRPPQTRWRISRSV